MTKGTLPSNPSEGIHTESSWPGEEGWRDQSLFGPVPGSSGGGGCQLRSHFQLQEKDEELLPLVPNIG